MLVLDGSGTVGKSNFDSQVKQWVKNVSKSMEIDKGLVQIGVVSIPMQKRLNRSFKVFLIMNRDRSKPLFNTPGRKIAAFA